ncbi:unnamed protein product, partial [Ectocarpus fasciculatus]
MRKPLFLLFFPRASVSTATAAAASSFLRFAGVSTAFHLESSSTEGLLFFLLFFLIFPFPVSPDSSPPVLPPASVVARVFSPATLAPPIPSLSQRPSSLPPSIEASLFFFFFLLFLVAVGDGGACLSPADTDFLMASMTNERSTPFSFSSPPAAAAAAAAAAVSPAAFVPSPACAPSWRFLFFFLVISWVAVVSLVVAVVSPPPSATPPPFFAFALPFFFLDVAAPSTALPSSASAPPSFRAFFELLASLPEATDSLGSGAPP